MIAINRRGAVKLSFQIDYGVTASEFERKKQVYCIFQPLDTGSDSEVYSCF